MMSDESKANWMEQLKSGDAVVLAKHTPMGYVHLKAVVDRTTKTQILLSANERFSMKTGLPVGYDGYFGSRILPANEANIAMVIRESLIRQFEKIDPKMLTVEQLKQIKQIVDAGDESKVAA